MLSIHCPVCGLPFPFDVRRDVRISSYCEIIEHWEQAGIDLKLCATNMTYLLATFVPLSIEERRVERRFRRMVWWLEAQIW